MPKVDGGRGFWCGLLVVVIVLGIVSRVTETGFRVVDKYLGDALYAGMVYGILRLTGRVTRVAVWAAVAMTAIELFQLTGIPAAMYRSAYTAARVCARLLGTEFSGFDLLAYGVGIALMAAVARLAIARGPRAAQRANHP
jgi:hypothetical protein